MRLIQKQLQVNNGVKNLGRILYYNSNDEKLGWDTPCILVEIFVEGWNRFHTFLSMGY